MYAEKAVTVRNGDSSGKNLDGNPLQFTSFASQRDNEINTYLVRACTVARTPLSNTRH